MNRQERISANIDALERFGSLEQNGHLFTLEQFQLRVYNVKSGNLVAFSSTKADYRQSAEEFFGDYGG
jgi:hypothetical protein